jgi:hypothetical protein
VDKGSVLRYNLADAATEALAPIWFTGPCHSWVHVAPMLGRGAREADFKRIKDDYEADYSTKISTFARYPRFACSHAIRCGCSRICGDAVRKHRRDWRLLRFHSGRRERL